MVDMKTKVALKLCQSFEDFDSIMNQTWCKTDADKVEYLQQLFNVKSKIAGKSVHEDYLAIAHVIMDYDDC